MKVKIINFGYNKKPLRAHYNDAGADVYSTQDIIINPQETVKIPLGFGLELPDGVMACVYPRTSMASKGIVSHIPPVDSGYKGEIHAIVSNLTGNAYHIHEGDKIAQLVITNVLTIDFVDDLGDERNDGAFGSTGMK